MAVKDKNSIIAASTTAAPNDQDFEITNMMAGESNTNPKLAIFIATRAVADNTAADHASMVIGMTDGTTQLCSTQCDTDNLTSIKRSFRAGYDDSVLVFLNPADGTVEAKAIFKSFSANKCTLTWTTEPPAGYRIMYRLFGGDDLTAQLIKTEPGPIDGAIVVGHSLGKTPDLAFMFSHLQDFNNAAAFTTSVLSMGFATKDGTQNAVGFGSRSVAGTGPSVANSNMTSQRVIACTQNDLDAGRIQIGSFSTSSVTIWSRDTSGHDDDNVALAVLNFNGAAQAKISQFLTEATTGAKSYSWAGFEPFSLTHLTTDLESIDTVDNGPVNVGIGFADADEQNTQSVRIADGVNTSDCDNLSDDVLIRIRDASGAARSTATFDAFTATGYDVTYV